MGAPRRDFGQKRRIAARRLKEGQETRRVVSAHTPITRSERSLIIDRADLDLITQHLPQTRSQRLPHHVRQPCKPFFADLKRILPQDDMWSSGEQGLDHLKNSNKLYFRVDLMYRCLASKTGMTAERGLGETAGDGTFLESLQVRALTLF
ncbi:hypothetical protein ARMGADRAFT_1071346 [Armillaria gallica]|uniref:Uncharacterized protein n=1 Tax=Armillaria gallica TaxID=47427 RepID=A0A2H3EFX2_ARMGA|nr:hypothetical protein ARMGADRAFT_1071346 [Armillaria gallica]